MIVVMKHAATAKQIAGVINRIEDVKPEAFAELVHKVRRVAQAVGRNA